MTSALIMAHGPSLIKKQNSLFIIPDELNDDNALPPSGDFTRAPFTNKCVSLQSKERNPVPFPTQNIPEDFSD